MSQEKKITSRSIRALSPVNTSRNNRASSKHMSRLTVEVPKEGTALDPEQYDLTPVFSGSAEHRGPNTPSYSIDPWEVVVSPPTSPNESSLDSGRPPRIIVARTSGDSRGMDGHDSQPESFDREDDEDDEDDNGYDPDDEQEDHMDIVEGDRAMAAADAHANGVIRTSNPANRFLVPSDIHPNMEQRDEDIAQLRLLAGKLNADWRGQDFMAPALARLVLVLLLCMLLVS